MTLESIEISDSVTKIGETAFWGCENLVSVIIPHFVTSIGGSAFHEFKSLISIVLPDSLEPIMLPDFDIGLMPSFTDCISLESVILPASATGSGRYDNCEN